MDARRLHQERITLQFVKISALCVLSISLFAILAPTASAHDGSETLLTGYNVWRDELAGISYANVTARLLDIQFGGPAPTSITPSEIRSRCYQIFPSSVGLGTTLTTCAAGAVMTSAGTSYYYNTTVPETGTTHGLGFVVAASWTAGLTTHEHTATVWITPRELVDGTDLFSASPGVAPAIVKTDSDPATEASVAASGDFELSARAVASRAEINATTAATYEGQAHANATWCPLPCMNGGAVELDYVGNDWFNDTWRWDPYLGNVSALSLDVGGDVAAANVTAQDLEIQGAMQVTTAADDYLPFLIFGGLFFLFAYFRAWAPAIAALMAVGASLFTPPLWSLPASVMLICSAYGLYALVVWGILPRIRRDPN